LGRDETGKYVAAGMVVVDGELAGIFDVAVDEAVRRRGYARQLMNYLLDTGLGAGAHIAYLQVEYSNSAARGLYASLGFTDRYSYWYRTQQHD
jgi:ribosomal protein S18 acetylase RimI-like enzyme